jgi:hypothetical protein
MGLVVVWNKAELGWRIGGREGFMNEAAYASSLPSLRMVMYFSHKSPVT